MRVILRGGLWCDVTTLPDDRVVWVVLRDREVVEAYVLEGDELVSLWRRTVPQQLLYLRAAADRAGHVLALGQGQDGHVRAVIDGRAPIDLGPSFGVFPVEVCASTGPSGWDVWVVRPGALLDELAVLSSGEWASFQTRPMDPAGSTQGLLQADGGRVRGADRCRLEVPGVVLAELADDGVALGQNADQREERLLFVSGARTARAYQGFAFPPHLVRGPGGYVACAWTEEGAWLQTWAADGIPWGNDAPPPPPPAPPDVPFQIEPGRVVPDVWAYITAGATAVQRVGHGREIAWFHKSTEEPDWGEWWDCDDETIGHLEDASTGLRLWAQAPRPEWRVLSAQEHVDVRAQGVSVPDWGTLPLNGYYWRDGARFWAPRRFVRNGLPPVFVDSTITWRDGRVERYYWTASVEVGYGRYQGRDYHAVITYDARRPDEQNPQRRKGGLEKFCLGPTGWVRWERWKDDEHGVPQLQEVQPPPGASARLTVPGPFVPPQRPQPYGVIWRPTKDEDKTMIDEREAAARARYPAPRDVVAGAFERFKAEVLHDRDRLPGEPGCTTGALWYFFEYFDAMAEQKIRHGVPGNAEGWLNYSVNAFNAVAQRYWAEQGKPGDPR